MMEETRAATGGWMPFSRRQFLGVNAVFPHIVQGKVGGKIALRHQGKLERRQRGGDDVPGNGLPSSCGEMP